MSYNIQENIML